MLLTPSSGYYLSPAQRTSMLALFYSFMFVFESLEAKFLPLLSQTQQTFVLSFSFPASTFCNEEFSLSLAGCLVNSGSRRFCSPSRRLDFWSGFNGRLRCFYRLRKTIGLLTGFFQNFNFFHSHVTRLACKINFHCFESCSFICKSKKSFVITNFWPLTLLTKESDVQLVPFFLRYLQLPLPVAGMFSNLLPI